MQRSFVHGTGTNCRKAMNRTFSFANKKSRKKITARTSMKISLQNYKLNPNKHPEPFDTKGSYKNEQGVEIPLLHRDKVCDILKDVDRRL